MNFRLLVGFLTLGWTLPALSQTISTDRPDQTEAATLVPEGGIQFEVGVSGWTSGDASTTGYTLPTALLRYGLHPRLELRAIGQRDQIQSNFIDLTEPWLTSTGWDLGAKIAGWNNDASQMCILAHYRIRPGNNDGGQVRVSWAKPLSSRFSLGTNVGLAWTWATENQAAVGNPEFTLSLGYNVSQSVYAYAEAFELGAGLQGDAGLVWRPNAMSQWDISAGWTNGEGQSYVAMGWSKLWMPGKYDR